MKANKFIGLCWRSKDDCSPVCCRRFLSHAVGE